jgi:hypothetical protein
MELIAAVLIAGPLGYFVKSRKRALIAYLVIWAVIFPIQTVDVHRGEGLDVLYWVFNAVFLAGGLGLNRLGSHLRRRRDQTVRERASVEARA